MISNFFAHLCVKKANKNVSYEIIGSHFNSTFDFDGWL